MTIQDIGSIGELIGAVAVIISLIYLATQIRQNTRAVRIQITQAIMESSNQIGNALSQPEVDRIYRKGRKHPESLTVDEKAQFMLIAGQVFNLYEGLYLHHKAGAINDDFFNNRWKTFQRMLKQPGFAYMLENGISSYYAQSFAEAVKEIGRA